MKNPLKKLKVPKKKSKTDLSDVLFYVPLLISFVFAYFVYSKSNQLIISALIPISVFFNITAFQKRETRREERIEGCVVILFSFSLFFFLGGGLSSRIHFGNQFIAYL